MKMNIQKLAEDMSPGDRRDIVELIFRLLELASRVPVDNPFTFIPRKDFDYSDVSKERELLFKLEEFEMVQVDPKGTAKEYSVNIINEVRIREAGDTIYSVNKKIEDKVGLEVLKKEYERDEAERKKGVGTQGTNTEIQAKQPDSKAEEENIQEINGRPYCEVKKGIGYLKFGKYGTKNKIGRSNSRPFLFLQSVIDPIGLFKTVDAIFTSIWKEKDSNDPRLTNAATAKARKVEIIKNSCIKELQKKNKLDRRISFEFDNLETKVRAMVIE